MPQPRDQHSQTWSVFLGNCRELETQPADRLYMAHNSVSRDLPLLYQKTNLCCRTYGLRSRCLDKEASETEVPDARRPSPAKRRLS